MKILKVLVAILLFVLFAAISGGLYVNYALPDTGPANKVIIKLTKKRIERGQYLANHVTVCMDCHSKRDWSLFTGPMRDGSLGSGGELFDENAGFPGKIYAPNLTPHALSTWSDGELLRAITTGVSKDENALFPLMGYSRFGKMDREDIYSIIAYIRSIKSIDNKVLPTQLNFPVNFINKTLPKKANFQSVPSEKDSIKYGAYLVNAAGCIDCHSRTDKGSIIPGTEFGGGMEFKSAAGIIRSPNITMHKTNGLGNWNKEVFVQRFKVFSDSTYTLQIISPNDLNTPMPWTMYAGMKRQDLEAIYIYLKSLKPIPNKVVRQSLNKS